MSDIEATKFYVRHREGYPETELQDIARRGFWTFGVETVPFEWIDDIDSFTDLGPTCGIAGYIGDVHRGLTKLSKPIPPNVDYPKELREFFGRDIETRTLYDIRRMTSPVFIKPVEHKLFTGFVYDMGIESRRHIVTQEDDVEVFACKPINIVSEYRSFILDGEVLDCRRYKGDYGVAASRKIVEEGARIMKDNAPRAFCLDWGVKDSGETILVEMNEGYAFGTYGLLPTLYTRMLSARWSEMTQ